MSDCLQPHGLYPTRLPCLWHVPGKNTEAGCLFLLKRKKKKSNYINIFKEDILIRKMDILFNLTSCSENKLFPNYDIDGYVFNIFCRELRSNLENEFFSYLHLKPIWEALPRCLLSFPCSILTAKLGELCSDEMGTFLVSTPWQLWKLFRSYHDGYSLPKMMDGQHLEKDDMKFEKWY